MLAKLRKIKKAIGRVLRNTLFVFGAFAFFLIILAFTSIPFWARYNLGVKYNSYSKPIKTIVLMGGGGYPSKSVLMRMYYTAKLSQHYPDAEIVVAIPGDTANFKGTAMQTVQGLIENYQIDSTIIRIENKGVNTRQQAMYVSKMEEQNIVHEPLLIVTSTEHVYRSVRAFRKVGLTSTFGQPTLNSALESNLEYQDDELGGNQLVPDVGASISIRYKFWDYLQYEIQVAREYIAIAYYKVKGWI